MKSVYLFILIILLSACGSKCVLFSRGKEDTSEKETSDQKAPPFYETWTEDGSYYRDITGLVKPKEFYKLIMECDSALIIDARPAEEYDDGPRIKGAQMIAGFRYLKTMLKNVNKEHQIMVYCSTETRSPEIIKQLRNMGFLNIYELKGGLVSWERKKLPMVNPDGSPYQYDK